MVFTNDGLNAVKDWLIGSDPEYPKAIAVGTTNTTPSVNDTALIAEVFRKSSTNSGAPFLGKFEMNILTTEATGNTINECGLFNDTSSTSGTLFVRNIFASISKTSSIEVQIEQRVEIQ